MARYVLKSFKILPFTQDYGQQWKRVFWYGLNSCLYGKNYYNNDRKNNLLSYSEFNVRKCGVAYKNGGTDVMNTDWMSNVLLYSDDKVKREKFSSKLYGECEMEHRKDERGEYKIVVCKKDGKKNTFDSRDIRLGADVSLFKVLGAVAFTLFGIILAAYSTVFFVSMAANLIVIIAIIAFFVVSYRICKYWWKGFKR